MELIDKAAIVVEIEKLESPIYPTLAEKLAFEDAIEECKDIILANSIKTKEVDLEKESMNYLLNEHKSPLTKIMHGVDLGTEMQYHKDIQDAFKAGFKSGLKAKAIKIPMVEWQSPCGQCGNPQMDCMNCPNHPVNRYETAYQKVIYQGNPTKENKKK